MVVLISNRPWFGAAAYGIAAAISPTSLRPVPSVT